MSSILKNSGISSLAERAPDDGSPEFYLDCDPSRAPKLFTSCPVLPTEAAGKMKMAVLTNIRHERFAQGLAGGLNATEAYNSAGYRSKGAPQNAARLKARPSISTRVQELQSTIAAGAIAQQISDRNARVQALQDRRNWLGAALDCLLRERAKDMAEVPGGQSGLLCREFKNGKENYRIDPGVMAVMAELRALERQAAQELGQWADRADGEVKVDLAAILNSARDRKRKALIEEERFEAERRQKLLLEG